MAANRAEPTVPSLTIKAIRIPFYVPANRKTAERQRLSPESLDFAVGVLLYSFGYGLQ